MKGDKSQVSNYKPTSLLTGFSKIFELFKSYRLKYHRVSNNIPANEQYGFRDKVLLKVLFLNSLSRFLV